MFEFGRNDMVAGAQQTMDGLIECVRAVLSEDDPVGGGVQLGEDRERRSPDQLSELEAGKHVLQVDRRQAPDRGRVGVCGSGR